MLIGATYLLILVSFPHALEDFHYGDLLRLGISVPSGIAVLGLVYVLQVTGIVFVLAGHARGALLLATTGAVWCVGALLVHGHDAIFAGPGYRHGAVSKLLELLIIIFGAAVAIIGIRVAQQGRT